PSIIFSDEASKHLVQDNKHLELLLFDELPQRLAINDKNNCVFDTSFHIGLSQEDIQAIKFTGGTTGLAKGVMQPYRAWNANIMNQIILWELNETDKFVACAPLSHGSSTYILPLLAQGGSIVVCESTELEAIQD